MNNKHKDAIHNTLIDIKVNVHIAIEALEIDDFKTVSKSMGSIADNMLIIHQAMTAHATEAVINNIISLPFEEAYVAATEAIKKTPHIMFHPRMSKWVQDNIKSIKPKIEEREKRNDKARLPKDS
jgi:hypothetical protein